jgi:hypothetical protein
LTILLLEIVLLQIKEITVSGIAQAILNAKQGVLTADQLERLAQFIPTEEEVFYIIY